MFLDRDGVIIEETGHLSDPAQVVLIPGAAEAIARLNQAGIPVVVVTNQAGVARGYYTESRIHEIHARLNELLALHEAHIDRYYYCLHHPTEGIGPYRCDCECRKPRPGMLHKAARDLGLDLSRSYMVGDKLSDLEAGANAGCQTILVRTGYGHTLHSLGLTSLRIVYIADDLSEAVEFCLPLLLAPRCV